MPLVATVDVAEAAPLHLRVKRGATFELDLTYGEGATDFSGRNCRMTVVVEKTRALVLAITQDSDPDTEGVIVGDENQLIHVLVPEDVTATWPERLCEYDIEMDQGSDYWVPVVSGKFIITRRQEAA